MSPKQAASQRARCLSQLTGKFGYLREAYRGSPYATQFLCAEAFLTLNPKISASVLRERLPTALLLVEQREGLRGDSNTATIERTKQNLQDFVDFCERKEAVTGEPLTIAASF